MSEQVRHCRLSQLSRRKPWRTSVLWRSFPEGQPLASFRVVKILPKSDPSLIFALSLLPLLLSTVSLPSPFLPSSQRRACPAMHGSHGVPGPSRILPLRPTQSLDPRRDGDRHRAPNREGSRLAVLQTALGRAHPPAHTRQSSATRTNRSNAYTQRVKNEQADLWEARTTRILLFWDLYRMGCTRGPKKYSSGHESPRLAAVATLTAASLQPRSRNLANNRRVSSARAPCPFPSVLQSTVRPCPGQDDAGGAAKGARAWATPPSP